MSMRVYEFTFSNAANKARFSEPYGGGQNTYIANYWATGTILNFRFYHYKSYSSGKYNQEVWLLEDGTWKFKTRSSLATLNTEPYTSGWSDVAIQPVLLTFFTANITANAYGTVSRAKLFYDASAMRSATATANQGSTFIGWFLTGTETQVTTNDDFTVAANVITLKRNPVSADIAVEARFTAAYLLTTSTNNTLYGDGYIGDSPSVVTSMMFESGSTPNIRAVVKDIDYKFSKWTLGGSDYSTSANIQITTGATAQTYVAVFIPIKYTLDVTAQNASHGTVSVDGQLPGVTTGIQVVSLTGVTVRAVPTFGYTFLGWYKAGTQQSTSADYSFTMPEEAVALEARFLIIDTAATTITKTKGLLGAADAKDMGSVSQYHLDTVFDTTSDVGTATLVSNLFLAKSYKFVPAPADDTYQFDGWFQTVDGSEVAITTGGIFTVDGNNLYILPTTTAAIAVNAQFSKRDYCEITPLASDSSVYEANNAAETALCTCVVSTPPDDTTSDPDTWLTGQTITVEARQASGWELRSWIVQRLEDGLDPVTVYSKSKGDAGFGQTFSFPLLTDVQVIAVSAYTLPADQMQIQALLKSGQPLTSGTVEIHPCGDNYVEMENGSTANVDIGAVCELTAIPANGYKFLRWRVATEAGTIVSTVPTYSFTVTASAVYYAEFEATGFDSLVLFESGAGNKTLTWAGKTYLAPVPSCMSSARVYADSYPVLVSIGMSDNPSHPANVENVITSTAPSQNPFRLPMRRPRKSIVVEITATDIVSEVCIATSMEGLKNG
jgi:hypothetical protein